MPASHEKALDAIKNGRFKDDIVPVQVNEVYLDQMKSVRSDYVVDTDEGPRAGSTLEALGRLRPVFAQGGTVTAGNSSQTSDGAAFVMVMSEEMVKELNVEPIARLIDFTVVGLEPRIMGMGPMHAIPQSLKNAGMKLDQLEQIELNEASPPLLHVSKSWGGPIS